MLMGHDLAICMMSFWRSPWLTIFTVDRCKHLIFCYVQFSGLAALREWRMPILQLM